MAGPAWIKYFKNCLNVLKIEYYKAIITKFSTEWRNAVEDVGAEKSSRILIGVKFKSYSPTFAKIKIQKKKDGGNLPIFSKINAILEQVPGTH